MSGKATNIGESTENPQSVLILPEHAACAGEHCSPDAFNLEAKLGRLLRALRAESTKLPLAVVLTGDWGTGKSSAMHWLCAELLKNADSEVIKFKTCSLKPWKYQNRDAVLNGLLEVVIRSVTPPTPWLKEIWSRLLAFFDGLLSYFKVARSVEGLDVGAQGGFNQAISTGRNTYRRLVNSESLFSDSYESALRETLQRDLGENIRLVVFIDDLDRCLPEVAIQVLEAMKLFFDQTKVIFILGVDRDVVDRMMVRHYIEVLKPMSAQEQLHVSRKARQYLDKMFQIEVQVAPTDAQIRQFAEEQVVKIQGWDKLAENHQKRLVSAVRAVAGINPRGVIRSLNSAFIGSGNIIEQIEDIAQKIDGIGTQTYTQQHLTKELAKELDQLKTSLAQAVQLRLVEAVLAGAEVAAIATSGTIENYESSEPEGLYNEDWHALTRHALGREFLHSWSIVVQGPVAQYLRKSQIDSALMGTESEFVKDNYQSVDQSADDLETSISDSEQRTSYNRIPKRLAPLFEVARRFPSLSPLLSVSALGAVLAVVEFAQDPDRDIGPSIDTDFMRLAQAVARYRQVNISTIDLIALRQAVTLRLPHAEINDEEIKGLSFIPGLRLVDLEGTLITNIGPLADCGNIEHLDLSFTSVSDISPLSKCTKLFYLSLRQSKVADVSHLSTCEGLEVLSLRQTRVTSIVGLGKCRGLVNLNLRQTRIVDISTIAKLASLRNLDVSHTQVASLAPLSSCSILETLAIRRTKVSDVSALKECKMLKELDLFGTKVADISQLAECRNLVLLNLNKTMVTDLSPLMKCPHLKKVVLPDGRIWNPKDGPPPQSRGVTGVR